MSLRVDLMREDERRYQGPVGRKFLLQASVATLLGAFVLWVVMTIVQVTSLRAEVARIEAQWKDMQPRYKAAQQTRARFQTAQELEAELKPWAGSRVDWAKKLDEVVTLVPGTIQLTKFSVRGDWSLLVPPAPPPPDESDPDAKPKPAPPASPARRFMLSITGRAAGELGSDHAGELVKDIKRSPGLGPLFESVKLQNVLREAKLNDVADRSFSIEGVGVTRKLE